MPGAPDDATRKAFTLAPVHSRRDGARITAVTVDAKLHRLFLGLSTGWVHALTLFQSNYTVTVDQVKGAGMGPAM